MRKYKTVTDLRRENLPNEGDPIAAVALVASICCGMRLLYLFRRHFPSGTYIWPSSIFLLSCFVLYSRWDKNNRDGLTRAQRDFNYQQGLLGASYDGASKNPVTDALTRGYKLRIGIVLLFVAAAVLDAYIVFGLQLPSDEPLEQWMWAIFCFPVIIFVLLKPALKIISAIGEVE